MGIFPNEIPNQANVHAMGMDSIAALSIASSLRKQTEMNIDPGFFERYTTADKIADDLAL